ncbi:hypothetical protein QAD02_016069 [Eretmocerus hayati]|uniref:Uncharacterized protein n=1 Tax=Eretmocerus hayati TaxID=131215 RepID=A0ACC2PA09_9HYME|nr:hypothetical protein QAD02_016069 [Eretmocerus hayati]
MLLRVSRLVLVSLVLIFYFCGSCWAQRGSAAQMGASSCHACRMHEEIRALSLEAIKEQILNKLGLKQAPNMTGRALPRIPPINKLMDMYGMQADQPQLEPDGNTEDPLPDRVIRRVSLCCEIIFYDYNESLVQE